MCGIWGHYGYFFEPSIPTRTWQKFTIGTAIAIQLRGIHSVGWYAARKANNKNTLNTQHVRVATSASKYFLDDKNQPGLITNLEPTVYLGHVRAATVGAKDEAHAHPHIVYSCDKDGKITDEILSVLTHNGTLRDWHHLRSGADDITKTSDSAALGWTMHKEGAKSTLDELNGAFALAFYSQRDNLLTLARNDERPLFFVQTPTGILWCSEPVYCDFGLQHANLELPKNAQWQELTPYTCLQVRHNLTTGGKLEVVEKDTLKKPTTRRYYSTGYTWPEHTRPAYQSSRSMPVKTTRSPDSEAYEIKKGAVAGVDYPSALEELYLLAYRIRVQHKTPGAQAAYTSTWDRTHNWPEDKRIESAGSVLPSGEPVKSKQTPVTGPTSTLQCLLSNKNGEILTFGDLFSNNYQTMRSVLNVSKRQSKRMGEEAVVFNLTHVPTSVACGLLEDTNASFVLSLKDLLQQQSLHLYRHTNATWSHWGTWSNIQAVMTQDPASGAVLICPSTVLNNPYIYVPGHNRENDEWFPYCQEAMQHCGTMLYFESSPDGVITPVGPQDMEWAKIETRGEYFLFPVSDEDAKVVH